jgi:hypothetical protein
MQGEGPKKDRRLVWQLTTGGAGFACTGCLWAFPNPKRLTEQEHDAVEVNRAFSGHVCNREPPLKKFNW